MFKRLRQPQKSPLKATNNLNKTYTQRLNVKKNQQISYWQQHKVKKAYQNNDYQIVNSDTYLFQGKFQGNEKNGQGILFTRTGTLIVGYWQRGQLEGRALIMTSFGGLIYAGFINGRLNGWVLSDYGGRVMICTKYFQDRLDSERIIFEESSGVWVASKYSKNGKFIQISHVQKGVLQRLPSFIKDDYLQNLLDRAIQRRGDLSLKLQKIKYKKITNSLVFLGYIDEVEDKPSGLGLIYSHEQFYAGNFKEGALNCYGRIIFENGDIYHGQFNLGMFQGKGSFYQALNNSTTIVQSINNQFIQKLSDGKGYISVNIEPLIGKKYKENNIGTNGNGLIQLSQFIQQYYFSYCVEKIKTDLSVASLKSQHPVSDKSQISSKKQKKPKKQQWIDMNGHSSEQQVPGELYRVMSLGKKQIQSRKNFQTTNIRQNYQTKQQQAFNKKSPNIGNIRHTDIFPTKSVEIGQITFREDRIAPEEYRYTINFPENKIQNTQIDGSNHQSQISNLSLKVDNLLKGTKQKRKRSKIFH